MSTTSAYRAMRLGLLASILVLGIGCDQATKKIATRYLAPEPPRSYLRDTLRLQFAYNSGAFLGLAGNLPPRWRFWVLTVVNAGLLAVVACVLLARWNMPAAPFSGWALILAGGIGNLIDRTTQGGLVTDFLNLGVGPVRTGIFNVADMAITAGACVLVVVHARKGPADSDSHAECDSPPPAATPA